MDEIIEEYLKFIQLEKGLSENTIGAYRRDLKKYQDYLEEEKISHIDFIDRQTIQVCLGDLHDKGHLRSRLPALFLRYGAFISLRLERNMRPKIQPY